MGPRKRVAASKLPDLNTTDLGAVERIVAGTARSMGIDADLGMRDRGSPSSREDGAT